MENKKLLTMQDLSCVGQCSLTVALPVLSHLGVETCVLPTAVLSNHTAFKKWSYLDLTPEIKNIMESWRENGFLFDGFLLGYLGKKELMQIAEECFDQFSAENAPVVIDPAFGDNGKLYGGFDLEYVAAMKNLLRRADIILPNLTEACFLLGWEYPLSYDKAFVERAMRALAEFTNATVVVTGVEFGGKIGEAILCAGEVSYVMGKKLPKSSHGTGDIFAAAFTAQYMAGKSLFAACAFAGDFVADCIRMTPDGHDYGVCFERVMAGSAESFSGFSAPI